MICGFCGIKTNMIIDHWDRGKHYDLCPRCHLFKKYGKIKSKEEIIEDATRNGN
ncbi:MAG: hypothetical protein ACTSP9_03045 [Promethearchaeota archaeon]